MPVIKILCLLPLSPVRVHFQVLAERQVAKERAQGNSPFVGELKAGGRRTFQIARCALCPFIQKGILARPSITTKR